MPGSQNIRISNLRAGQKTIRCYSWDAFQKHLASSNNTYDGYVFRGQAFSTWDLASSLLRSNPRRSPSRSVAVEKFQLDSFKKRTFGFRSQNLGSLRPDELEDNEWFALGQHYGLKTPLLDWTESPYVATFFAFWEKSQQQTQFRTIWAINKELIQSNINNVIKRKIRKSPSFAQTLQPLQFHQSDLETNKRLLQQKGLFTKDPGGLTLNRWVKNCATELKPNDPLLIKFVIPNSYRNIILKMLDRMNLNPATLFPDLTGVATYCNHIMEIGDTFDV